MINIETHYYPFIVFRIDGHWVNVGVMATCGHACFDQIISQGGCCNCAETVETRCGVCRTREKEEACSD